MWTQTLWTVLVDASAKSAVLLLLAWLTIKLFMRHSSAARRHLVWTGALCACLVMPALSISLPQWQALPNWNAQASLAPLVSPVAPVVATPLSAMPQENPVTVEQRSMSAVAASPAPTRPSWWTGITWRQWAMLAWFVGVLGCLVPLAIGRLAVARICRPARPYRGNTRIEWPELLSAKCRMPMACGILHRRVVLPDEAEHWQEQRVQAVLDHELAHVRRRDCLWQTLGQMARALYWFNPLAWIAYRQLLCDAEKACDDTVLTQGSRASSYAEHLMAVATTGRSDAFLAAAAIAMARSTTLEGRLMSILDSTKDRRRLSARAVLLSVLGLVCLVAPLAMLKAQTTAEATAGRLDFRMAVNRGRGDPVVAETDAARLISELARQGPDALEKQNTAMAWFPLSVPLDEKPAKVARAMPIAGQWKERWYLLVSTEPKHTMLADEAGKRAWGLVRAYVAKDSMDKPAVGFDFDQAGAERFRALTTAHIGGCLAVLVDGQVENVATINSVIFSSGIITSQQMTEKEVSDLVTRLQRGMPAVSGPVSKPSVSNSRGWDGFDAEVEIVVPAAMGDPKAGVLRLADGKLVIPPPEGAKQPFGAEWNDWARESGVDLMASNNDMFQGLLGFDMAAVPIGRKLPASVAWASSLRDLQGRLKPGSPALMSAAGTLPFHYVIQTRNGILGIISILELTDNPKGVKIRYRLLQADAGKGAATNHHESGPQYAGGATSRPVIPTSDTVDWQSQLKDACRLADGQAVKRVQAPFVPARMSYWKMNDPRPPADHTPAPDQIVFLWNGQVVAHGSWGWGQMDPLGMVLQRVMEWTAGDFEGSADLLTKRVPGDWVVRSGATEQEKVASLLTILQHDLDPSITIKKQQVEREVIVVRGKFQYQRHADASGTNQVILYSDPYVADTGGGGGAGTLASFLTTMGNCAGMQVVDEVDATRPEMVSWHTLESCWLSQRPKAPDRSIKLDSLLKNVAAQTGLVLTREKRKADVWVIARKAAAD